MADDHDGSVRVVPEGRVSSHVSAVVTARVTPTPRRNDSSDHTPAAESSSSAEVSALMSDSKVAATTHASDPGSAPGSAPGSRPGSRPGSQPGSQANSRSNSRSSTPVHGMISRLAQRVAQFRAAVEGEPSEGGESGSPATRDTHVIDLDLVRELAFEGVPETPGLRSMYWKLLLGYLPPDRATWPEHLESQRAVYETFVDEFMFDPHKTAPDNDHPLSQASDSAWKEFHTNQDIMFEINKDVLRTCPDLSFFTNNYDGTNHYAAIKRILFLYTKLNPGIGYVQGMNEIVAPLYYVFYFDQDPLFAGAEATEADTFFTFTNLMAEIRDNFCKTLDVSDIGVMATIGRLNDRLRAFDPELAEDLDDKGINPQFYSFRWVTLLLSQEFEFPDVLRLWDSFFADRSRFEFMIDFCCAMLVKVRGEILGGDFAESLKLLQHYPPLVDPRALINTAREIRDGTWTVPAD